MPKTDDLTLLVLKGHLLIEELINSSRDALLPNSAALKAARLDCYRRTRLLMALLPTRGYRDILEAFQELNAIRNKFGHVLEPPQIGDRIEAFVISVESSMDAQLKARTASLSQRRLCFKLCGASAASRVVVGLHLEG